MLLSGSAWREKLEHAEICKQEETKELQVLVQTFLLLI